MAVDPKNGNVTGTVQYESRDLSGALVNMANGTLLGGLTGQLIDIEHDPYWDDLRKQ